MRLKTDLLETPIKVQFKSKKNYKTNLLNEKDENEEIINEQITKEKKLSVFELRRYFIY